MEMAFFCGHNEWVAKRQGHCSLEFHIVHLLEPAPQTQTATAHLQTTWTVYFDGQGTQILPSGKIPGGGGGGGDRLAYGLSVPGECDSRVGGSPMFEEKCVCQYCVLMSVVLCYGFSQSVTAVSPL